LKVRPKSRRKVRKKGDRQELGILAFLGAAFLLVIIGYFLTDHKGIRLGVLGSYVWLMAFVTAFFAFLAYYAQFILPVRGESGWYEGLRILVAYFVYAPAIRPPSGNVTSSGISPSFNTLRAGLVESHQALALAKGAAFTRAAGPGYVVLNRGEWISALIDLRRHLRRQQVKASTQDGIPLETVATVIFRVQQLPADQAASNDQYPYDPDAIFRVSFAGIVQEDENQQSWADRVCPQAATLLVAALARHNLDDLFPPNNPNSQPAINLVKEEVYQKMVAFFEPHGVEIIQLNVGRFELPPDVTRQRIQTWQAEWQRRITVQEANANAEVFKRLKNARARTQVELISKITQSIDAMRRTGHIDLAEIITLRMMEALDEAVSDTKVQNITPRHILENLGEIRKWVMEDRPRHRPRRLEERQRNGNETT
jgi:hypothetical protein